MSKNLNITLIILNIVAAVAAVVLLSLPAATVPAYMAETRYGVWENRQVVVSHDSSGETALRVEDADGKHLFDILLKNCTVDTRYRDGQLMFRDTVTGARGFFDISGAITMLQPETEQAVEPTDTAAPTVPRLETDPIKITTRIETADPAAMTGDHPFRLEALKVLSGKLQETDSARRRQILDYCEHFRKAYTGRDIDFLRQVFSDNALIIVGHVVKTGSKPDGLTAADKVKYDTYSKTVYLDRLSRVFESNSKIDVRFSDFSIMRHPTVDGIYGVSLRQQYAADRYSDDGRLFLLWDFRDPARPMIHVRTWQETSAITADDDIVSIEDFNLQ